MYLVVLQFYVTYFDVKFSYNPEWFADEDEDEGEEWNIEKYRRETEAEHDAQEAARLASLNINDDGYREETKQPTDEGS